MTDKYYYEHQAPEHEWLEWYKQHESKNYVGTSTTIDLIVVKLINDQLSVLIKSRDIHPFKDQLALPGSYLHSDEKSSTETMTRIYSEKLNLDHFSKLKPSQIQQLATYADKIEIQEVVSYQLHTSYTTIKPKLKMDMNGLN